MSPKYTNDIERIASKSYWRYRTAVYAIALCLTWLFIFAVYVGSLQAVAALARFNVADNFRDPRDYFFMFYGLGVILATALTLLFGIHFLTEELESRGKDKGLVRDFLKVRSIREGRRKMKALQSSKPDDEERA